MPNSTSTPVLPVPRLKGRTFVGNTFDFKKDRLELFQRTFAECGDIGIYTIAGQDCYFVNSIELCHEILIKNGSLFEKTDRFRSFARPLLGDGLLTATNEEHKRNRRLIQPRFRTAVVRHSADITSQVSQTVVSGWNDGDVIDVRREMVRLVLGVVGQNLFSRDILGEADDLGNALTDAIHGFDSQASALIPLTIEWPTPANLRYRKAIERLESTFHAFLAERRAMAEKPDDWLTLLLECTYDDGTALSDKQIRDEALNMFMPGHETTATALTWSFHLLSQHPECYERLMAESDRVLGGRAATGADLERLPYALQVFKEAMRLYPPVYMFSRQATTDVEVGGHRIPAGASVIFSPYALHRRADYFPDPERFDPDRFESEREAELPRHAYMPFGAGHRVCIGNHHALLGGQVALATLAGQAHLTSVPGPSPVMEPMVTLRPEGSLSMKVTRRSPAPVAPVAPGAIANGASAPQGCPYGH